MKKLAACVLLFLASALLLEQSLGASAQPAISAARAQSAEKLSADTPKTTVLGNAFIAPKDWSIRVEGPATILEAPRGRLVGCTDRCASQDGRRGTGCGVEGV